MKELKEYVSPETITVDLTTNESLAIVFDPSQTTSMQLSNDRDDNVTGDESEWGDLW